MNHICDQCETVRHCAANGCIPVSEYDDRLTTPERFGWAVWIAVIALSLFSAGALVGGVAYFAMAFK